MNNIMLFEEFCKNCMAAQEDKDFAGKMRKKAKRSRYKDQEHEKERGAFMKNRMKGEIPKK